MSREETVRSLRDHLDAALAARAAARDDPASAAARAAVRAWQAERLASTYADLRDDPRYRAATEFFLSDLYSTRDHGERDAEMERALPKLARMLPAQALEALGLALEVDALSERLDAALADRLFGRPAAEARAEDITVAKYARAYRAAADRADRERQIDLIDGVGSTLDRIAHSALLTGAVTLMRAPARAAGFGELQGFLERGLEAFRGMQGATEFLAIVRERERAILERLFAATTDPFDVVRRQV